jgi:hypothetical protein
MLYSCVCIHLSRGLVDQLSSPIRTPHLVWLAHLCFIPLHYVCVVVLKCTFCLGAGYQRKSRCRFDVSGRAALLVFDLAALASMHGIHGPSVCPATSGCLALSCFSFICRSCLCSRLMSKCCCCLYSNCSVLLFSKFFSESCFASSVTAAPMFACDSLAHPSQLLPNTFSGKCHRLSFPF